MGCNACTVSCKDWNGVNPGPVRWRKQETFETANGIFPFSMSCNHCAEPACADVCPTEAIIKRPEDGVVYIDRTKCVSAQTCIDACPFAVPKIAGDKQEPDMLEEWEIEHPMQKCDFCMERLARGEQPVCVAACNARALDSGDYDELIKKYPDAEPLNFKNVPYAFARNDESTKPSFLIKRKKQKQVFI